MGGSHYKVCVSAYYEMSMMSVKVFYVYFSSVFMCFHFSHINNCNLRATIFSEIPLKISIMHDLLCKNIYLFEEL